jgi:mono/diheme cytochrome c family protein
VPLKRKNKEVMAKAKTPLQGIKAKAMRRRQDKERARVILQKVASITALVLLLTGIYSCDYARMKEQESLRPYETSMPEMPEKTIPTSGGFEVLRLADPAQLENPVPVTQEVVRQGKEGYNRYCIMCHGPKAQGNGTVGQSFYPLPTNLRGPYVQEQKDGRLFLTVTFGFKRHPPLGYTVAEEDRWAIIHYIRSLT